MVIIIICLCRKRLKRKSISNEIGHNIEVTVQPIRGLVGGSRSQDLLWAELLHIEWNMRNLLLTNQKE